MKNNKILSVIMSILMIFSLLSITGYAASDSATSGSCGQNAVWEYDETTATLTISGTGPMDDYNYPGYPWIDYKSKIKNVIVSDGITVIGYDAFYWLDKCEYMTIGPDVVQIKDYGVSNLSSLQAFIVDGDNQYFTNDEYGVLFNKDMTELIHYPIGNKRANYDVPEGVETIEFSAFGNGEYIRNITLPDTLITIEDTAFFYCPYLNDIEFPEKLETIGNHAFAYCGYFTEIVLPESVTLISSNAFAYCDGVKEVIIGEGIREICNAAFEYCERLEKVTIGKSIEKINDYAFDYCSNITDVYYTGTEEEWKKVVIGEFGNNPIHLANIHYNACIHSYKATVTEPNCKDDGFTTYTCECGYSYVDDYVDALGHTPKDAVEENYVAPTCTENGSKDIVVYCFVCEEEISRETAVINATGHNYASAVVMPTCTSQGYTTYICDCGYSYISDYVEATGHADNDGDGYCDSDNELLDPTVECNCNCHKSGIKKFFFKIALFFQKLFKANQICGCGIAHY